MDTELYRYVAAVADTGSISGAARRLFVSQPTLTKQIGRLEVQLGVKLFDRSRTPLVITKEGEIFLKYAVRYLDLEHGLMEELEQAVNSREQRVLVAATRRGGSWAGNLTAAFLKEWPQLHLEYLSMDSGQCELALETDRVELAIYTTPVVMDTVEYIPLQEDRMVLIVPGDSPVLEGRNTEKNSLSDPVEIEIESLRNKELMWVRSTENHSMYQMEEQFFSAYQIEPCRWMKVDDIDTRYNIARSGCGIALIPEATAKNKSYGGAVFCRIRDKEIYRYVIVAKKRGKTLSKGAEAFWKFVIAQKFR